MRNRMTGILMIVFSASGVVLLGGQAARMAYGQTPSEAVSRSFTVTHVAVSDPPTINQEFSRSITVWNVGNCAGDLDSDRGREGLRSGPVAWEMGLF